ncbi:hypothetical protein Tco_1202838 [Tanacetum coccineum]
MVGTRQSTLEFSGPAFEAAVQRVVDALLPSLTTRLTNEIRQNDTGEKWSFIKQPKEVRRNVLPRLWKDFRHLFLQYFPRLACFVGKKAGPPEEQAKHFKWALCDWILDGIVNTEFTDVAQVANAARNMEILRERSSQNNKRTRWGPYSTDSSGYQSEWL